MYLLNNLKNKYIWNTSPNNNRYRWSTLKVQWKQIPSHLLCFTVGYLSSQAGPGGGEVHLCNHGHGIRWDEGIWIPCRQEETEILVVVYHLVSDLNHVSGACGCVFIRHASRMDIWKDRRFSLIKINNKFHLYQFTHSTLVPVSPAVRCCQDMSLTIFFPPSPVQHHLEMKNLAFTRLSFRAWNKQPSTFCMYRSLMTQPHFLKVVVVSCLCLYLSSMVGILKCKSE